MLAIGARSRSSVLALAFGLCATALEVGCNGSSSVIEQELSESARKAVFQKRVDVENRSPGRVESRNHSVRTRDRRP
jgi:hypothetical protein